MTTTGRQPDYGPSLDEALHVRMFQARRTEIDTRWHADGVLSSFWRLYLNAQPGAAVITARPRQRCDLRPGRVYVIPAWIEFHCRCRQPVGHTYLHFDVLGWPTERVRALFDQPMELGEQRQFGSALSDLMLRLTADRPVNAASLCLAKSLVFHALGRMIDRVPAERQHWLFASMRCAHVLQPAVRFVEQHLKRSITNHDLARTCHLSESQLVRRFHQVFGKSPAQYVIERRVTRAAQALIFGQESIDAIADACGFANRYYFSRVFRQRMGLPPAAYRRNAMV